MDSVLIATSLCSLVQCCKTVLVGGEKVYVGLEQIAHLLCIALVGCSQHRGTAFRWSDGSSDLWQV